MGATTPSSRVGDRVLAYPSTQGPVFVPNCCSGVECETGRTGIPRSSDEDGKLAEPIRNMAVQRWGRNPTPGPVKVSPADSVYVRALYFVCAGVIAMQSDNGRAAHVRVRSSRFSVEQGADGQCSVRATPWGEGTAARGVPAAGGSCRLTVQRARHSAMRQRRLLRGTARAHKGDRSTDRRWGHIAANSSLLAA